jgi:RNA-directed DNA polymerase
MKLQDLRRKIYLAAKSDKKKRFWGMYCHVVKREVLVEAYKMAKENNGSAGIDRVTFEQIEQEGIDKFIDEIHKELVTETYIPMKNRHVEIPKSNGKKRMLGIPTIRDRVVQGALKLILEAVFEADFSKKSFGYRPKKTQHEVVARVGQGIMRRFTKVIDVDLTAYFDNVNHHILMKKVSKRINDPKVMRLLKLILKASGKKGVPQGGVISPLLSNIYLNAIDHMFEKAIDETSRNGYEQLDYYRFADDMVILVNGHEALDWLTVKAYKRLKQELDKLKVQMNTEKTKIVNMENGETFGFMGFDYRMVEKDGEKMVMMTPKKKKVLDLIEKVRKYIKINCNQKIHEFTKGLNQILQGWVNFYRIGHSTRTFNFIRQWVERKVRRHVRKKQGRQGYGWKVWSREIVYGNWGLYDDYKIRYYQPKANPIR